jgi:pimeloyl-ACP methyl ester carboxylesterase
MLKNMLRRDQFFQTTDGDFHFIDWGGSGPLSHFSHATGLCAGTYTPLAQRLKTHLRVVGMDDRGHGTTRAPTNPRKLKNWDIFVEDLERFFEHLGEPVIAMGHSRGAAVSLLLAVRRPELIRALVLIDPTIWPISRIWRLYLAKKTGLVRLHPIVATAARRRSVWPDRETILSAYRSKTVFKSWQDGFLDAYIKDGTQRTEEGTVTLRCQPAWESRCFAACPLDIWRFVPRLQQPVLVLYGAGSDIFLAPAANRFKSKVPHTVFHCFEGTGHFVPMERPDDSTAIIHNFLKHQNII